MPDYQTVIVGAGFSGIGAAIKLDEAGLGDYLIVEAGSEPGGTWYWNTYPGIGVDIPSFSYQFSFEQSPDWSRTYAPGRELKAYADHCVEKYGIAAKIRFDTEVVGAAFDDDRRAVAVDHRSRRRDHGALPHQRRWGAEHPETARHRRRRQLRRGHPAHRALGSQPGPDRQARGDHRHRGLSRPGHPGDRTNRQAPHRLSAHADLVLPQTGCAPARARRAGPCGCRAV